MLSGVIHVVELALFGPRFIVGAVVPIEVVPVEGVEVPTLGVGAVIPRLAVGACTSHVGCFCDTEDLS